MPRIGSIQPATPPLLHEGLEQAGITRLPRVQVAQRLKPLVEDELAPRSAGTQLLRATPDAAIRLTAIELDRRQPLLIAIGPEGGWTESENVLFQRASFREVTLGPGTLRSDVAAITALGILTCRRG